MNEAIQQNGQVDVSIVIDMGIQPIEQKNSGMMIDMKKGELSPLFADNDKEGIPKVPDFGNVKEPEQIGRRRGDGIVGIAGRQEGIAIAVGNHTGFNGHIGTEKDLRDIVEELNGIETHGRNAEFHNGTADQNHE
jgi:hypothetical protein